MPVSLSCSVFSANTCSVCQVQCKNDFSGRHGNFWAPATHGASIISRWPHYQFQHEPERSSSLQDVTVPVLQSFSFFLSVRGVHILSSGRIQNSSSAVSSLHFPSSCRSCSAWNSTNKNSLLIAFCMPGWIYLLAFFFFQFDMPTPPPTPSHSFPLLSVLVRLSPDCRFLKHAFFHV